LRLEARGSFPSRLFVLVLVLVIVLVIVIVFVLDIEARGSKLEARSQPSTVSDIGLRKSDIVLARTGSIPNHH